METNTGFGKISRLIPFENINKGEIVKGTVRNIQPYGAFIRTDDGIDRITIYRRYFYSKNKDTSRTLKSGAKD